MPCRARAMPRPCRSESDFSRPRHGHGHGMCELASAVQWRHVGDLPAFGFFRLPRGFPRRLLSGAYQSVKLYFRLACGISRRTRHCRRMAGARHGMCELVFILPFIPTCCKCSPFFLFPLKSCINVYSPSHLQHALPSWSFCVGWPLQYLAKSTGIIKRCSCSLYVRQNTLK
jgi:hypothetical protein